MIDPCETDVMVLVGGLGTRLQSVVSDRPKALASINGRPFLHYLIRQIEDAGFRRVVLCTGFRGAQIEEALASSPDGLEFAFSREETPLGTAGALRFGLDLLESSKVVVLNGDSFIDVDLCAFLQWYDTSPFDVGLVAASVADASRFGTLDMDQAGTILAFREKRGVAEQGWINAGVYIFSKERLLDIPVGRTVSLEQDIFPEWSRQGAMGGYRAGGRFIDIGTPESYSAASRFFEGKV
ncbi:MAG TPA: nucleotidyltransferase family protein [Rhizomicrobium sp.]|nr:nucleotidyltransferase family protein [Rhizomicrobium sp.]